MDAANFIPLIHHFCGLAALGDGGWGPLGISKISILLMISFPILEVILRSILRTPSSLMITLLFTSFQSTPYSWGYW